MREKNEKRLRVGIYLRLSDEDNHKEKEEASESIKNQRMLLLDEIRKQPKFLLVDEYCDEDLSGAGTYRPQFERLIKDCEEGKIDVVLCKSQSRFSRDMEMIEKYLHNKFIEWNVRFISLADNADTANIGNKKARQINGLVNEWYLEDVSNNIRSAFHAKMIHGEFISPFASFGYDISLKDNNQLVVDPFAKEIIKEIYHLYLEGFGYTAIAKYLNKKQIPSPSLYKYQKGSKLHIVSSRPREEIKWNPNAIKKILTNELYIGHLIQGKRTTVSYKNHKIILKDKNEWITVKHTHEAIIDEDTFYQVQKAIQERKRTVKKAGIAHLFSGKVVCLECGHVMRKKNSSKHTYLVCSSYQNGENCSNHSSIRYDTLAHFILESINQKIHLYYDQKELQALDSIYFQQNDWDKLKRLKQQKSVIEKRISKTKHYLTSLYIDKINKELSLNQFHIFFLEFFEKQKQLEKQLKEIEKELTTCKEKKSVNHLDIFKRYQTLSELNKIIIDTFIEKIYIGKSNQKQNTREIQIKWNF